MYVFQQKDPPVHIFDREGNHLGSWGNGAFVRTHGFRIVGDVVYLTGTDDSVVMTYTLDGRALQILGRRGEHSNTGTDAYGELVARAAGPFNHPTQMVPSPSGDLYVSDGERNARVHRFSADGRLKGSWGQPRKRGPGQFHLPHGILVDREGLVYVCDRENSCIQVFSSDGEPITRWTDVQSPCEMAVDEDGVFYVSQLAYNATHRYPGYPAPGGTGSAITDSAGRRTILPPGEPQVSVLDGQGKVLTSWKSRSPHGIWVDSHRDIYIGLSDDRQVDKYVRQE